MKHVKEIFGFNVANFIGKQIVKFGQFTAVEWNNGFGKGYLSIQYILNLSTRLNYEISNVKNTSTPELDYLASLDTNVASDSKLKLLNNLDDHLSNVFNYREPTLVNKSFTGIYIVDKNKDTYQMHVLFPEEFSVKKLKRVSILLKNENSFEKVRDKLFSLIEIDNLTINQAISELQNQDILVREMRVGNKKNFEIEDYRTQNSNSIFLKETSPFYLGIDDSVEWGIEILTAANNKSNNQFVDILKRKSVKELLEKKDTQSLFNEDNEFSFSKIANNIYTTLDNYLTLRNKNVESLKNNLDMLNLFKVNRNNFYSDNYKLNLLQQHLTFILTQLKDEYDFNLGRLNTNKIEEETKRRKEEELKTNYYTLKASSEHKISIITRKLELFSKYSFGLKELNINNEEELSHYLKELDDKLKSLLKIKSDEDGFISAKEKVDLEKKIKEIYILLEQKGKELKKYERDKEFILNKDKKVINKENLSLSLQNYLILLKKENDNINKYDEEDFIKAEKTVEDIINNDIKLLIPTESNFVEDNQNSLENVIYFISNLEKEILDKKSELQEEELKLSELNKLINEKQAGILNIDFEISSISKRIEKAQDLKKYFVFSEKSSLKELDLDYETFEEALLKLKENINILTEKINQSYEIIDLSNKNVENINKEINLLQKDFSFTQLNKNNIELLLKEQYEDFIEDFENNFDREDLFEEIKNLNINELSNKIEELYFKIQEQKNQIENSFSRLINSNLSEKLKRDHYGLINIFKILDALFLIKNNIENELNSILAEKETNNISLYEYIESFVSQLNLGEKKIKDILLRNSKDILNIKTSAGNYFVLEEKEFINYSQEVSIKYLKDLVEKEEKMNFESLLDKETDFDIKDSIEFFQKIAVEKDFMYDFFINKIKDFNLYMYGNPSTGNAMVLSNEAKHSVCKANVSFSQLIFCDEIANVDKENAYLIIENAKNKNLIFLGNQGFEEINKFLSIKNIAINVPEKAKNLSKGRTIAIYNKAYDYQELVLQSKEIS